MGNQKRFEAVDTSYAKRSRVTMSTDMKDIGLYQRESTNGMKKAVIKGFKVSLATAMPFVFYGAFPDIFQLSIVTLFVLKSMSEKTLRIVFPMLCSHPSIL